MLNEILNEYEKLRESHKQSKNSVSDIIANLRLEVKGLEGKLEGLTDEMNVICFSLIIKDGNVNEIAQNELTKTLNRIESQNIIKNYNNICNNFYANLTKFGKVLSKNLENGTYENFDLYDYDKQTLLTVIIKYFTKIGYY